MLSGASQPLQRATGTPTLHVRKLRPGKGKELEHEHPIPIRVLPAHAQVSRAPGSSGV